MARRRDQSFGGRWLAGEDGALFVTTDGVSALFDWHADEVYPTRDLAAAAWERVRARTWAHEQREYVFPPAGAVYDGLISRTEAAGPRGDVLRAVEADLAVLEEFRRRRPDAASAIEGPLSLYENALHIIAGAFTASSTATSRRETWDRVTRLGVWHGEAA